MKRLMKPLALAMALLMVILLFPIEIGATATGFTLDQNRYVIAADNGSHVVTFTLPLAYNGVSAVSLPTGVTDFSITADEPISSNLFERINSSPTISSYNNGVFTFTFSTKGDTYNGTYPWSFKVSYKLNGVPQTDTVLAYFKVTHGQDTIDGPDHNANGTINNGEVDQSKFQTVYDITLRPTPIAKDDKDGNVNLELHLAYKGDLNFADAPLSYFRIEPVVSGKTEEFPFELEYSSYGRTMADITVVTNDDGEVTDTFFAFPFKVKDDAVNGYYPISFKLYHLYQTTNLQETTPAETTITTYVEIRNGKKASSGDDNTSQTDPSTAILLLEGYTAEPDEIKAGDEFDLTLKIRNTSDQTVTDVKSTLSEVNKAVLPVSGASSFFIEKIKAGETVEQTVRLKATASAGVVPVELTLANAFVQNKVAKTSTDTFILPVIQVSNLSLDPPSYPIDTYAGESFNLMMNLYNKGKSMIYNVSVYLDSESMTADENYYAGNMDSGSSKSYDVMVTPNAEAMGQIEGDIVVTYEDAEGNVTEKRTPITLNVATYDWGYEDEPIEDVIAETEPVQQGVPFWVWILAGVAVLGAGTAIVVIVVRNRRGKAQVEDDEMD